MSVDLQQIINSPFAVKLVSLLARIIPPGMGYPLCDFIGNFIAARKTSTVTRAVRTNQWVIWGTNLEERELNRIVQQTFRNNARDIYTLYHNIHSPKAMR